MYICVLTTSFTTITLNRTRQNYKTEHTQRETIASSTDNCELLVVTKITDCNLLHVGYQTQHRGTSAAPPIVMRNKNR